MNKFRLKENLHRHNPINWDNAQSHTLINILTKINTHEVMRLLVEELMTKNEIDRHVRKIRAIEWLMRGAPYEVVIERTGLSSATIAGISKRLVNKNGGFQTAMSLLYPRGFRYFD